MITDWNNKKVCVIGAGVEGISSAKFFKKHGALVTILDQKLRSELEQDVLREVENLDVQFVFGDEYLQNLSSYDLLVRSPGVKSSVSEIVVAKEKGVEITSQTKLFFDLCLCPIIGVTGTKGKGTTATLIYEMLMKDLRDVYLGGNIGKPPLNFLDTLTPQSLVVLELSSFQLQDMIKSPHIAVVLMITSEHLDYHGDVDNYIDAKRNILRFQTASDAAILNRDYPATNESDMHTDGKVFFVSRERQVEDGCFVNDGAIWLKIDDKEKKVINTGDVRIPGRHNWENACAAALAATLAGVSIENIRSVLGTFAGLEHRLELVAEVNGVTYYDDSIATNPESAIAGIESFNAPKILILGGVTEGSSFDSLGKVIAKDKNIKAIIGIGKEWPNIKEAIKTAINRHSGKRSASRIYGQIERSWTSQDDGFTVIEGARDMRTIVAAAAKIAQPGDVVLLSPACKSFDMFKDYKDRGDQFKREVFSLEKYT